MWGSFTSALNSVVSDLASKTAALIEGESDKEKHASDVVLPWLSKDVPDEKRAEVETRVRNLSEHKRTFTEAPPKTSSFAASFSLDNRVALAALLLDVDQSLARWRWDIVPGKISEEAFWCNYFYRVELILDAVRAKPVAVPDMVAGDILDEATPAVVVVEPMLAANLPERRKISNIVDDVDLQQFADV